MTKRGYCGMYCAKVLREYTLDDPENPGEFVNIVDYCSNLCEMWDNKGIGWCDSHAPTDEDTAKGALTIA